MRGLVYRPIKTKGDNSIDLQGAYRRDETSSLLSALLVVIREFSPFVATSHAKWDPKVDVRACRGQRATREANGKRRPTKSEADDGYLVGIDVSDFLAGQLKPEPGQ